MSIFNNTFGKAYSETFNNEASTTEHYSECCLVKKMDDSDLCPRCKDNAVFSSLAQIEYNLSIADKLTQQPFNLIGKEVIEDEPVNTMSSKNSH